MAKNITQKTKEIHKLYEECKKIFQPSLTLFDEIPNIEDETEREFLVALCNFFMQQSQRETIAKGIF